jgi:hypothetical protein
VLIPLTIVIVIVVAMVLQRPRVPRWSAAVEQLGAPRADDTSFAAHVSAMYQADGIAVEVRAANGLCLVNLPGQSPSGLRARLAGKLTTFAIACDYAAWRQRHGDNPVATAIIFADGNRYLQAGCDGVKHPELVK